MESVGTSSGVASFSKLNEEEAKREQLVSLSLSSDIRGEGGRAAFPLVSMLFEEEGFIKSPSSLEIWEGSGGSSLVWPMISAKRSSTSLLDCRTAREYVVLCVTFKKK